MTDRQHIGVLFTITVIAMMFVTTQCTLTEAEAAQTSASGSSIIENIHLFLETLTFLVICKIAMVAGKIIQWKDDHERSNNFEFKNLNRRIDDVKHDMRAKL